MGLDYSLAQSQIHISKQWQETGEKWLIFANFLLVKLKMFITHLLGYHLDWIITLKIKTYDCFCEQKQC